MTVPALPAPLNRRRPPSASPRPPADRRAPARPKALVRALRARVGVGRSDAGMATAEYAIVTIAAVAFGGLLITILSGSEVRSALLGLIRGALSV
jgi:hypothetical protein